MTEHTHPAKDVEALRELVRRQTKAWATDASEFASTFTEDADFVAVDGRHLRSRAEIAKRLGVLFRTSMAGSRMASPREIRIRFLSPHIAVMATNSTCVLRESEETGRPEALSVQTRVAVKRDGSWLFTTFHHSRTDDA